MRQEFWKNGKLVGVTENTPEQELQEQLDKAKLELFWLDEELGKHDYHKIKDGTDPNTAYTKPIVRKKDLYLYKLKNTVIGDVLGSFPKYGELPIDANEGDLAYNETLSGLLLTKPSGIYQFQNGTWVLVQKILS